MIRKLIIASLLLCGVALAQPSQEGPGFGGQHRIFGPQEVGAMHQILPPGRWWKDADVVKTIGLSDAQVQKIEQIFQDSRMKLVDIHGNLQKEEIKLEPLLEADTPDESAVLGAIDRIAAARTNLEKANAQMAFAIRRVLTPEQWKKLRGLRSERRHFPAPMGGPGARFQHDGGRSEPSAPAEPPTPPAPPAPENAPQPDK